MTAPTMKIEPTTLTGKSIRLEPLTEAHTGDLDYACRDPVDGRRTIWRYLLDARIYREGGMDRMVKELLARQAHGTDGTPRSSAMFSILDSEWPAVEVHLENLMARGN
jgi:hypothetical protein